MMFDADAGVCLFEIIVGIEAGGEAITSGLCLIQADDSDEAEDKALEYLDSLDLDVDFWVEEMSEPYGIDEYQRQLEEDEKKPLPTLDELTEEEFRDFMGLR